MIRRYSPIVVGGRIAISQIASRTATGRASAAPQRKLARTSGFKTTKLRKSTRRRLTRFGLITGNLILFAAVLYLVAVPSHGEATAPTEVSKTASAAATAQPGVLDQLASATIAKEVAQMTGIGEVVPVTNQADSEWVMMQQASIADDTLAFKPQIVASAYKSNKDIQTYVVQAGDTINRIADKFGVTSDSIRWSNDLTGNDVAKGKKLLIPPVNGIVYKVKNGDTAQSLADHYDISRAKVVQYNDAELKGLRIGSLIILPGAREYEPEPVYQQPYYGNYSYGYNGYDYGYCTWYVANNINVPVGWGNANTWDDHARYTPGWRVSSVPRVGAIAQNDYMAGGVGHVAIVLDVSADGSRVKIADMNGIAGWGREGVAWQPTSTYQDYISR